MLACPECRKLHPNDATACAEHGCALVPLDELGDGDPPLEPGTMVGEYRIVSRLGAGSFGDVYAGEQPLIGKKVAVKILHRKLVADRGVMSRFLAEARAVNRVRHRNIIDIFSFGHLDERPYFVMELLEGKTLGDLLEQKGRLSLAEALPILQGIADGLDAAHAASITHRDLKPDNIFLAAPREGGYFPKLLDFGVAKLLSIDSTHRTATGAAVGTPSYMAPEQCRGKGVDHRADIYALGAVVHEMLTGRRLFDADSPVELFMMHVTAPPPRMSSVCPEVPPELDAPVLAMLEKNPADRPRSAGEAIAALTARARGLPERPMADATLEISASVATPNVLVIPIEADATVVSARPPSGALVALPDVAATIAGEPALRSVPVVRRPVRLWPLAIAVALLIAVVAAARTGGAPPQPSRAPATVGPPLVTVVPYRDQDLPPVSLSVERAPAIPPTSGVVSPKPPAPKPAYHPDLDRPREYQPAR